MENKPCIEDVSIKSYLQLITHFSPFMFGGGQLVLFPLHPHYPPPPLFASNHSDSWISYRLEDQREEVKKEEKEAEEKEEEGIKKS